MNLLPAAIASAIILVSVATVSACKERHRKGSSFVSEAIAGEVAGSVTFSVPKNVSECEQRELKGQDIDDFPTPESLYIDAHCSELFMLQYDPQKNGVVSVFGSSKLNHKNVAFYAIKHLASKWAEYQKGQVQKIPLLTATGPGIMEAANCGVNNIPTETDRARKQAKRLDGLTTNLNSSLGYATTFGVPPELDFKSGTRAWEINYCTTHAFIFKSFGMRESEMIDRARISIIAPGGVGTEWEIFEILSKIQTGKAPNKHGVPLVILFQAVWDKDKSIPPDVAEIEKLAPGFNREFDFQQAALREYWTSLMTRLNTMLRAGTIEKKDLTYFKCAKTVDDAMDMMRAHVEGTPIPANTGRCDGLSINE